MPCVDSLFEPVSTAHASEQIVSCPSAELTAAETTPVASVKSWPRGCGSSGQNLVARLRHSGQTLAARLLLPPAPVKAPVPSREGSPVPSRDVDIDERGRTLMSDVGIDERPLKPCESGTIRGGFRWSHPVASTESHLPMACPPNNRNGVCGCCSTIVMNGRGITAHFGD